VDGKSFKSKKKKRAGGGLGENKVPKKKPTEVRGKKNVRSGLIKAEKGQTKKSTSDGTGTEKRILSVHHPFTLVHWWVPVHSGHRDGESL